MFSKSRESHTNKTMRCTERDSLSLWLAIPLLLVIGSIGCGLGDHGATSQTDGQSAGPVNAVNGFEAADAQTPVAGAAALPALLATDFCSVDSLAGIPETGSRGIDFDTGDMIPLCSGWVILADQTNNRIEIRNIVTGEVDSRYDLRGAPGDIELDLDAKRIYATLPAENLIESVDLLGGENRIAVTNSMPTSITQTATEILVAADAGAELRAYNKTTLAFLSNSPDLTGATIVFNPEDSELVVASDSMISVFDYALDNGDPTNTLTLIQDDPANGDALALEISPNFERVALVNPGGNASFAGINVINDYESASVDGTFGAWKVDVSPTSAAFSPLNPGIDDSDYLIASSASDLVVFDILRHAEISRTTPDTDCGSGSFDQVAFSRGGQVGLAARSCGDLRGTEFHWIAPAAGFGDSASTIGVDVPALAAVLPAVETDPLCTTDDLSSLTAESDGSLSIPRAGDIEPLCDGWVFVAERATNRVRLMNVITGATISEWDLPDLPVEMVIDEANKFLFVAMPSGGGVSRIDLAGPNRGEIANAPISGFPTSLTVGNANTIWAAGHFEPGQLEITRLNALSMNIGTTVPLEVTFESFSSQIAFDRTSDQLFVSDLSGFARFTLNGANFDLSDPAEELFDTLNSEIILASPDTETIALVDQTANLVYDFDTGVIADLGDTFWEIDSPNAVTAIAFDALSTIFGVATTDDLILFNAEGDHAELTTFTPNNCASDTSARAAVSRGGSVGFYKTGCGTDLSSPETIYWNEF